MDANRLQTDFRKGVFQSMPRGRVHTAKRKRTGALATSWKALAIFLAVFGCQQASAIDCNGKVLRVLLYVDGTVNILGNWRGDYTYICSTSGSWGNASTEVCLTWYASLVKARADNANVSISYNSSSTCATLPTYSASPMPAYIGLME